MKENKMEFKLYFYITDEELPKTSRNYQNFVRRQALFINFVFLFKTKNNTNRLFLVRFSKFITSTNM